MCNLSKGVEEKGIKKGIQQGIECGIEALIETCRELDVSKEETLEKVKNKFSLDISLAEKYLGIYWK